MTEKDFIKKLNGLKISPDSNWKEKNREILMSQVSASGSKKKNNLVERLDVWSEVFIPFDLLHRVGSKPVLVTVMVLVCLMGGGVISLQASKNTKPGDSLYIAKIVSEKAQIALTFDEKEKAKLGVEFAGNRVKEMVEVMKEEKDGDVKTQTAEKLTADFKSELSNAKVRLEKIGLKEIRPSQVAAAPQVNKEGQSAGELFGANLGKGNDGIQISDSPSKTGETAPKADAKASAGDNKATSTAEKTKPAENNTPANVLNDIQELFEKKDYDGAVQRLEEIKNLIDNKDTSLNDRATTTGEMVEMSAGEKK